MIFHILSPKNRQPQPMPKRVSRLRGGQILEPEYSCALTENPAIWQWPDPLGIRRVGRPLKVISSLSSSIAAKVNRAKGIWLSISLSAPLPHTAQFLMSWPCLLLNTQLGQGFYSHQCLSPNLIGAPVLFEKNAALWFRQWNHHLVSRGYMSWNFWDFSIAVLHSFLIADQGRLLPTPIFAL